MRTCADVVEFLNSTTESHVSSKHLKFEHCQEWKEQVSSNVPLAEVCTMPRIALPLPRCGRTKLKLVYSLCLCRFCRC